MQRGRHIVLLRSFSALVVCAVCLALWGCDSFDFYGLLSGTGSHSPSGAALAISPLSATLSVSASCTFTASGGTPPYRFSVVSGAGAIDQDTGVYTAPTTPSTDTVAVSDAAGATAEARATSVE